MTTNSQQPMPTNPAAPLRPWHVAVFHFAGFVGVLLLCNVAMVLPEVGYDAAWLNVAAVAGVVLVLAGHAWSYARRRREERRWRATMPSWLIVHFIVAIPFLVCLVTLQYGGNERTGRAVAQALVRYHADTGRWPSSLDQLQGKHLDPVPRYRYGMLPVQYGYRLNHLGGPVLKYVVYFGGAAFYDFDDDTWIVGWNNDCDD